LGKWKETVDQMNGTIQSLEAQMEVLNGTLELKDGIINSNEEHLKVKKWRIFPHYLKQTPIIL
jgi:hypothetical protein